MNHLLISRRPSRSGGFIMTGTLLVAGLSTLVLVSGCHAAALSAQARHALVAATPPTVSRPAPAPAPAPSARPRSAMPPLQPFDEMFYIAPAAEPATVATSNTVSLLR